MGRHLVERTFWFFASVFIFILAANWVGLIPGVGTVGWGYQTAQGFRIDQPLFRGANADLNLTLAMALVFFACWIVWALQELGPLGFLKELFAPKGETAGLLKVLMVVVFFAVGLSGSNLDSVPAGFPEFSSLRQHLCRGEHDGDHVPAGSGTGLVAADSILFPGIAGGPCPGDGFYVVDRGIHVADVSARGRGTRGRASDVMYFGGWIVLSRGIRPESDERKSEMFPVPLLAEISGNLHVAVAAFASALSVGLIGMKASDAVGRNPGAATKILVQSILAIAFAEAIVFYAIFLVK